MRQFEAHLFQAGLGWAGQGPGGLVKRQRRPAGPVGPVECGPSSGLGSGAGGLRARVVRSADARWAGGWGPARRVYRWSRGRGDGWSFGSPGNRRGDASAPARGSRGQMGGSSLGRPSPPAGAGGAGEPNRSQAGEDPGFPPIPSRVLPAAATPVSGARGTLRLGWRLGMPAPSGSRRAAPSPPPFTGGANSSQPLLGLPKQTPASPYRSRD